MFTCHLTGLTLTTGCAITTQLPASQKHWLIGLASDDFFNETEPAQLVLKNDIPHPGEQYSIVRQVDLISVDDNIECLVFDAGDFKAAKDYYKTESGVGARRSWAQGIPLCGSSSQFRLWICYHSVFCSPH